MPRLSVESERVRLLYPPTALYIRADRAEERFSIAFLGEEHREALRLCGRLSGADCDKLSDAGLTSCTLDGVPVVSEAKLVMVCRKLYTDTLKESGFYDRSLLANYPQGDFHRVLIGKIEKVYIK